MEGERIQDRGIGMEPEFLTTDTVQGYAPLDQYLMGFRPDGDVPDTLFYVTNYSPNVWPVLHPLRGVGFDGTRNFVTIGDVIQAMGRRTPDYTVAQRHFRFAFILVVAQGSQPSAADLAQIDTYRQQFEPFYLLASSHNATADTTLKRSMQISLSPAGGVVAGTATTAGITFQTPPAAAMRIQLQAPNGYASVPPSVDVPAGAAGVSFPVAGVKAGVEEVQATPSDAAYETAFARVQVADASLLKLVPVSVPGSVAVELTDANNLTYSGARIVASLDSGGSVSPPAALTDAQGRAVFQWTPGTAPINTLVLALDGAPSVSAKFVAGSAAPLITAVVNSASFAPGIAPGTLETIFGYNLAGGKVLLSGTALPLLYVSDGQINFYVPQDAPQGPATVTVVTPSGIEADASVNLAAVAPGIFGGAVTGGTLQIYCTGLGPTQAGGAQQTVLTPTVFIGAVPVAPIASGLWQGIPGLYQVVVTLPDGIAPGPQPVMLSVDLAHSNPVTIVVP